MSTVLDLVDWRRRTEAAFAAARSAADPEQGWLAWRAERDELLATHPASPLPPGDPLRETGVPYFDHDPAYRFTVPLLPPTTVETTREVDTGADGTTRMRLVGRVELPAPVGASLDVWSLEQYAGGLFVPLRDATAGEETYGGGRYVLDTAKGAWHGGSSAGDGEVVLDLNLAYHPSCRYDPAWQCPLAPPGNTVDVPVRAGERMPR